jgi:LysR family transcriptional activator of glutamate synthase operon
MDLHQLRVFQATARIGGFTRAGEHLHLSQSTVSQHVKTLEEELGTPLLLRVGKRTLVTEAGNILLRHAERILREVKDAEMAVRELGALKRGTVRVGVGATTLTYRLPPVLADYSRRFPSIELIAVTGTTEFLIHALTSQAVDLSIVMLPLEQPGVSIVPLCLEELVVVVNRAHPLARKTALDPADLETLRLILYEKNTAMQNLLDRHFDRLGIRPHIAMEMENIEAIKSLVDAGLGASILPVCAVEQKPRARLKVLRVRRARLFRELGLATLDTAILPQAVCELSSMIASSLGGQ